MDGILLDIGVSSHQFDSAERGFSYRFDGPLDMRMDRTMSLRAYDIVNTYSEKDLAKIIKSYGEERWADRIAQFIVKERKEAPIATTFQLVTIIKKAIPKKVRQEGGHPAKKTFHSLEDRIVKNSFQYLYKDCICPPRQPICTCGKKREIEIVTRKPVTASDEELKRNHRAHSAKLRIAEKI